MTGCCRWCILGGMLIIASLGLTITYTFAVWPFAPEYQPRAEGVTPLAVETPPPKPAKWETMESAHPEAVKLLERALERMHAEALEHFYADPRNGLSRMPLVYQKIVREWNVPWFSPGELDDGAPIPFKTDLERIHAGSVKDFLHPDKKVEAEPKVIVEMSRAEWTKMARDKKPWEAKQLDLIGLLTHPEPIAYSSEKLPEMKKTGRAPVRPLDEFEMIALDSLLKGQDMFARSRDGVIRMVGAVRANASCLKCHDDKKEGDLLGAFSYTLREAVYRRGVGLGAVSQQQGDE
jgi:hypothetical protein